MGGGREIPLTPFNKGGTKVRSKLQYLLIATTLYDDGKGSFIGKKESPPESSPLWKRGGRGDLKHL